MNEPYVPLRRILRRHVPLALVFLGLWVVLVLRPLGRTGLLSLSAAFVVSWIAAAELIVRFCPMRRRRRILTEKGDIGFEEVDNLPYVEAALPPGSVAATQSRLTTVFYPGLGGDLNQLARYMGPNGLVRLAGILNPRGLPPHHPDSAKLIHHPWLGRNNMGGDDVQPADISRAYIPWYWPTWFHQWFITAWTGVQNPLPTAPRLRQVNVAQARDLAHALTMTRAAMAAHPDPAHQFVLYGTSRGAAVALRVAAALTPAEVARVRLLVLEGVFDTVGNVLDARYGQTLGRVARRLLRWFTECDPASPDSPLATAQQFPHKQLPIAVVTSRVDWQVHPELTKRVAYALEHNAHVATVKLLELATSPHSSYATHNVEDRAAYAAFLQDMYSKHVV